MSQKRPVLIPRISTDERNLMQWFKFLDMTQFKSVLDLTGGAGGESLFFAKNKNVQKVTSYELDPERHKMFEDNIKQLPQQIQNKITLYNNDSTKTFGQKFDLVLFDPPWTFSKEEDYMQGKRPEFEKFQEKILKDYNESKELKSDAKIPLKSVDLKIGKFNVEQVIKNCNCKMICLKIPLNCIQSPYSKDYKPIDYPHQIIPIIYTGKIKYIVILIRRNQ